VRFRRLSGNRRAVRAKSRKRNPHIYLYGDLIFNMLALRRRRRLHFLRVFASGQSRAKGQRCVLFFFSSSFFSTLWLPIVLEIFCGFYVISRLTYWFQWPMIRVVLLPLDPCSCSSFSMHFDSGNTFPRLWPSSVHQIGINQLGSFVPNRQNSFWSHQAAN